MTEVMTAITTVGFPIVAFFVAVYALKYAFDRSREDNTKNMDTISKLADSINNNTLVLTQLVEEINDLKK